MTEAPSQPPPSFLASICIADDATFWPWLKWPDFARRAEAERTLVVIPITGLADAALGHPLDAEEVVLTTVLKASSEIRPPGLPLLVIPPIRFVLGPGPHCAFPVSPPVAHALIREVAESVMAAGFRRIVLFNASPWNEDLVDAAARDLRVALGLQMFCVNLSALGLDFHPARSPSRQILQTLLTGLYEREPRVPETDDPKGRFSREQLPPVPTPWEGLEASRAHAPAIVRRCAERLSSLLQEIHAHPELPAHPSK